MTKWIEYLSFLIIKTYFFVNGVIIVDIRITTEYSEVRIFVLESLLGLEFFIVWINFEIVEQNDITYFDIEGKILFTIAPEVDLKWFILLWVIDYFQFLSVVSVVLIAIDVGAVNYKSNGWE